MLQTLAASTGAVAVGQMISSQPAFAVASQGSDVCCYAYSGTPTLTSSVINNSGGGVDTLTTSFGNLGGVCPCGGTPVFQFAFYVAVDVGTGAFGWTTSSSVSWATNPPGRLWNNNGNLTVGAGIRVTCGGRTGTAAVCCRFASGSFSVPLGSRTFVINVTGTSPPSGVTLPACTAGLARSASPPSGVLIATPN
jgi:hypothetical protein